MPRNATRLSYAKAAEKEVLLSGGQTFSHCFKKHIFREKTTWKYVELGELALLLGVRQTKV